MTFKEKQDGSNESNNTARNAGECTTNPEEQAMQFAWEHPLYNNDLREFIKWTNKKED